MKALCALWTLGGDLPAISSELAGSIGKEVITELNRDLAVNPLKAGEVIQIYFARKRSESPRTLEDRLNEIESRMLILESSEVSRAKKRDEIEATVGTLLPVARITSEEIRLEALRLAEGTVRDVPDRIYKVMCTALMFEDYIKGGTTKAALDEIKKQAQTQQF